MSFQNFLSYDPTEYNDKQLIQLRSLRSNEFGFVRTQVPHADVQKNYKPRTLYGEK